MKQKKRKSVILILSLSALLFLVPIIITVCNSFMGGFEISRRYSREVSASHVMDGNENFHFVELGIIPDNVTAGQYQKLLLDTPEYLGLFWNSVKIALPVVLGQILISIPAAYAFEQSRFRCKEILFFLYILVMLMPLQVSLVPNYIVAVGFGIQESILGVILPGIANPFGVFLARQFMKGIPGEYLEAAKIDGCGHLQILMHIILPNMKSAVASLAILTFVDYWNLVEQAVIFIKDSTKEPFSVFLSKMSDSQMEVFFAAACFYMLPSILIFLYGHENMEEGIQLSGLK